ALSRSSRTCRVHHDVGAECGHHSTDRLVDHSRASRGVADLSGVGAAAGHCPITRIHQANTLAWTATRRNRGAVPARSVEY
ncbi:hypothetical protein ACFMJ4_20015, partial [Acinetobacter baumannii]